MRVRVCGKEGREVSAKACYLIYFLGIFLGGEQVKYSVFTSPPISFTTMAE